jgi:hypothetical protein
MVSAQSWVSNEDVRLKINVVVAAVEEQERSKSARVDELVADNQRLHSRVQELSVAANDLTAQLIKARQRVGTLEQRTISDAAQSERQIEELTARLREEQSRVAASTAALSDAEARAAAAESAAHDAGARARAAADAEREHRELREKAERDRARERQRYAAEREQLLAAQMQAQTDAQRLLSLEHEYALLQLKLQTAVRNAASCDVASQANLIETETHAHTSANSGTRSPCDGICKRRGGITRRRCTRACRTRYRR